MFPTGRALLAMTQNFRHCEVRSTEAIFKRSLRFARDDPML